MRFQKKKILVLVKTYPNPSTKYQETVCVAGMLLENPPSWIRLYPIPFRDLPFDQQFKKYEVIEAEVRKNRNDYRPESHNIVPGSIKVLETIGTGDFWRKRKDLIRPLIQSSFSMCALQRKYEEQKTSLGIFKPSKIHDFIVEPTEKDWTLSQKQILSQKDFFKQDKITLEKVPFQFKIKYSCNNLDCTIHTQGIIDWETSQLYRNLSKKYDEQKLTTKIREKYLNDLFAKNKDVFFIAGNQYGAPISFLILSVFSPPIEKNEQLSFFTTPQG